MKRTLLYIFLVIFLTGAITSVRASVWNTTTFDPGTVSAMETAYQSQTAVETRTADSLARIRQIYTDVTALTTTGIYMSKYLDQKGLRDIEFWNDSKENYYYKKIYKLAYSILVRIVRVTGMCLKEPGSALYWGTYIMKACADVQSLCAQFEALVTNCTLNFNDLPFLNFNSELQAIFNLSKLNGNNIEEIFDNFFSNIKGSFSKENLSADWENLRDLGVGLAMSGVDSETQELLKGTGLDNDMQSNLGSFMTLLDNVGHMAEGWGNPKEKLLGIIGENASVEDLFDLSNYNVTRWLTDHTLSTKNQYYTQTVEIIREEEGASELLAEVKAPSWWTSPGADEYWVTFKGNSDNVITDELWQKALDKAFSHTNYTQEQLRELNKQDGPYKYQWSYGRVSGWDGSEGIVGFCIWNLQIYRYIPTSSTVVESRTYDSRTMDWNTFNKQMQQKLKEYNDGYGDFSEEKTEALYKGIATQAYKIVYGEKRMYEGVDDASLNQATAVMIRVKCSDDVEIAEGSTSWKCNTCENNLSSHAHTCSMYTSNTSTDSSASNIKEFEDAITEIQKTILSLQQQKAKLTDQWNALYREKQGLNHTMAELEELSKKMAEIDSQRNEIQDQIDEKQEMLEKVKEGYFEAKNDEATVSDDWERMPYIMNKLAQHYNLQWVNEGRWEGDTFVREAKQSEKGDYIITFRGKLDLSRPAQYLLGIGWKPLKIHRAIIAINWNLTGHGESITTVATVQIPEGEETENSKRIINEKMEEVARDFPDCSIELKYIYPENPPEEDVGEDKYHLLWHADRLEVARKIEIKLLYLNTELAQLERYLRYRHSLLDWLVDRTWNRIHGNRILEGNRKDSIARSRMRLWVTNSGSKRYEYTEE